LVEFFLRAVSVSGSYGFNVCLLLKLLSHDCKCKAGNVGSVELDFGEKIAVDDFTDFTMFDFAVTPVSDGFTNCPENCQSKPIWANMKAMLERPSQLEIMAALQDAGTYADLTVLIDRVGWGADGEGQPLLPAIDCGSLVYPGILIQEGAMKAIKASRNLKAKLRLQLATHSSTSICPNAFSCMA